MPAVPQPLRRFAGLRQRRRPVRERWRRSQLQQRGLRAADKGWAVHTVVAGRTHAATRRWSRLCHRRGAEGGSLRSQDLRTCCGWQQPPTSPGRCRRVLAGRRRRLLGLGARRSGRRSRPMVSAACTLGNRPRWRGACRRGDTSVDFDGAADTVRRPATPQLIPGPRPFTIELWIKWTGKPGRHPTRCSLAGCISGAVDVRSDGAPPEWS